MKVMRQCLYLSQLLTDNLTYLTPDITNKNGQHMQQEGLIPLNSNWRDKSRGTAIIMQKF